MIVELLSPLPRAECLKRLQAAVASEFSVVTSLSVIGTIDGSNFRIRKTIYYRNSFQRSVRPLSDAAGGGTRIHGEVRELNLRWVFIAGAAIAVIGLLTMLVVLFQHRAELHAVPPGRRLSPLPAIVPLLVGIGLAAVAIRPLDRAAGQFLKLSTPETHAGRNGARAA